MDRKKVVNNLFWRFFERCGAQGVTFVVSIILARLLKPEVYGTIALISVIITVLQVFVDSGLGNALIQKNNADDLDFSTVFYFNSVVCVLLYMAVFVLAPYIAVFYDNNELTSVIRVLCLSIVISGIKNVQQAYVARNMLFKRFFFSTIGGTIAAAIIGVCMAYCGYGVWALVMQMLVNVAADTLILWITVGWRPIRGFSFLRLRVLFRFGWKILIAQLLTVFYTQLRQLFIGKIYTSKELAFYNQGDKIPSLIINNINSSIDSVLFPTLSAEQDSVERVKNVTRRAIKTSSYIMMPMMTGLAICGEPLVELILTEKWLPCVPYLRIFCLIYALYPIHTANLSAIRALGHSDIYLKLEIFKVGIGLVLLVVTMRYGVMAMAIGYLMATLISSLINAWPNKKLLSYRYLDQIKDMLPQILLSSIMGVLIYGVTWLGFSSWLTLMIQIPMGILIYISGSEIFHLSSYEYVKSMIINYKQKNKK